MPMILQRSHRQQNQQLFAREESSRKLDTAEDEKEALTGGTRPHQEVRLVRDAAPRLKKKLL
jgi:hypothetical protein